MRLRIVIFAFFVCALFALSHVGFQCFVQYPEFQNVDRKIVRESLQRITYLYDREVSLLDRTCRDWALWDQAYEFLKGNNEEFIQKSLGANALEAIHVDVAIYSLKDGTVRWGAVLDNGERKLNALGILENGKLSVNTSLFALKDSPEGGKVRIGTMNTPLGPMLFSVREVLRGGAGTPAGYLLMGRFAKESMRQTIYEQARTKFSFVYPYADTDKVMKFPREYAPFGIQMGDVEVLSPYMDVYGNPLFGIKVVPAWSAVKTGVGIFNSSMSFIIYFLIFTIVSCVLYFVFNRK